MLYVKRSSGGSGDGGFRNNGAGLDVHYYLLTTMLELLCCCACYYYVECTPLPCSSVY